MDKPKLTLVEKIPPSIRNIEQEDICGVIDVLERALADAREGNILACAVCMVGPDGRFGHFSARSARHIGSLVATVSLTHWRLCEEMWNDMGVETEEFTDPTSPKAS